MIGCFDLHRSLFKGFSRYDQQEEIASIYHYQDTKVLINKLGIRTSAALDEYESEITYQRQLMLEKEMTIKGRFTKTHLVNIHKFILNYS